MVGEHHHALTHRTLAWALERTGSLDTERHAKEAFLSSTFEVFCAPPDATPDENFVSMKFLLVFFRADDAKPSVLDEFVPHMDGNGAIAPGELSTYYDELLMDFRELNRDTRGFRSALRSMCTSMQLEKRADKTEMKESEYRQLRKHIVGVPAYTECWRTIRGVSFSPGLEAAVRQARLQELAAEIVYLVNDIGSLERDEATAQDDPDNVDPNFVLLRMRALGCRDAALTEVVQLENQRIADFQRLERLLLQSEHGSDPALCAYLEILRSTINGNLATMKHLVPMRYPSAGNVLEQIHLA